MHARSGVAQPLLAVWDLRTWRSAARELTKSHRQECLWYLVGNQSHRLNSKTVREHHHHHHQHENQGRDKGQEKTSLFVTEVHEIRDDQSSLHNRNCHQKKQHHFQAELLVSKKDFGPGEHQQASPDFHKPAHSRAGVRVHRDRTHSLAPFPGESAKSRRDQINQWKNEHPYEIDEMPIKSANLDIIRAEFLPPKANRNYCQINHSQSDVRHVQTGEAEEGRAE